MKRRVFFAALIGIAVVTIGFVQLPAVAQPNAEAVALFFWQTPEWAGAVAVGTAALLTVSIINALLLMAKSIKERGKVKLKSKEERP